MVGRLIAALTAFLLAIGLAGAPAFAQKSCTGTCRARGRCPSREAATRTLAYVVNECRSDARGGILRQALRIQRGTCAPVTVLEFPFAEPVEDFGFCRGFGDFRQGTLAVIIGNFQRLAVSPDGSGVVFEVTNDRSLNPRLVAVPEQEGFFFVRSDGLGLRRIGPASRDPTFRFFPDPRSPFGVAYITGRGVLRFSPNGRSVVYTDVGPGPAGEEAIQIVTLDLGSGERRQLSHLAIASPLNPRDPVTGFPRFLDDETIVFFTYANPDGMHPEGAFFTVRTDGTGLKAPPLAVALSGSQVVPRFEITGGRTELLTLDLPGTPVNDVFGFPPKILEVFLVNAKNLLQLTNFRRVDTARGFLSPDGQRAFFIASVNPPLLGSNPAENCQLFSIDPLGAHLRQLTRFHEGDHSANGCQDGPPPGCAIGLVTQDPVTRTIVFGSSCDPFGTNPDGAQIFAMRRDGSGLRQLTDSRGLVIGADGTVTAELPGPWAYSSRSKLVR